MAKVKITGHASGSGVLTITAPNTSTDRTITLPDSTGTILDENSSLPAANITGTLPAISGASLTGVAGRRNMVINGAMQVAQRGTSSTSESYQTVDRFKTYKESCEQLAVTQTQSTESPNGFSNSFELNVGTAESSIEANDLYNIVTVFEGQNMQGTAFGTSDAKAMILSFWVRSSKTGTYAINFYNSDATRNLTNTYAISSANTWEYKTVSILPDTSSGFSNDANRSFDIQWILTAGSDFTSSNSSSAWSGVSNPRTAYGHTATWGSSTSDDFHLTGVQLELGSVATDFEHRSYGEELALCQRYYQKTTSSNVGGAYQNIAVCTRIGNTVFRGIIEFPVTMRTQPSFSSTGNFQSLDGFTFSSVVAGDGPSLDRHGIQVFTSQNGSSGDSIIFRANNDATAALIYDAEL